MNTRWSLLASLLLFAAGGVVYVQSVERNYNKSFVVTFSRYNRSAPTKGQTIIQLVNSRGKSLIKVIGADGSELEHFVPQFAPGSWKAWGDRAAYLQSTHVIRTDEILGHRVYVFRQDIGGQMLETWYAPETGPIPLKQILETPNEEARVTEAIKIEFRAVSDQEVEPQLNLLRNYP